MSTKRLWAAAISVALGLGLCSAPAVAGPTVINHCQTLPASGSYVFGKNLTAAGGRGGLDCRLLGDDFITIDLNEFSITGFAGQGTGIELATNFGGGAAEGSRSGAGRSLPCARGRSAGARRKPRTEPHSRPSAAMRASPIKGKPTSVPSQK